MGFSFRKECLQTGHCLSNKKYWVLLNYMFYCIFDCPKLSLYLIFIKCLPISLSGVIVCLCLWVLMSIRQSVQFDACLLFVCLYWCLPVRTSRNGFGQILWLGHKNDFWDTLKQNWNNGVNWLFLKGLKKFYCKEWRC